MISTPIKLSSRLARVTRYYRAILAAAGHEASRGNVVSAAGLLLLYWLAR